MAGTPRATSTGNLYGVTNQGGTSSFGNIFRLTPNASGVCGGVTLSSLVFNPVTLRAGTTSQGTITLSGAAPSGGTTVGLSTDNAFGLVPATAIVAAGATSATFTFTAKPGVLSNTPVRVTPASVTAGSNSNGTVTLNTGAPSGGAAVKLSSSNTAVATVPSSVTVQAGKTSATFSVRTQKVTSNSSAVISGTFGGVNGTATLTVTPKN